LLTRIIETNSIMFPIFNKLWPTSREETQPVDYPTYTAKSRRARVAPYPTRPAPSEGYPLKPLRPKVSISDHS
jgi:hypothetical protein